MSRNTHNKQSYVEVDPVTGIQLLRAKKIASIHRWRAKKSGLEYSLTDGEWIAKLVASNGCCAYCGKNAGVNALTLEHVIPISQGGGTTRENVTPACKSCDSKKQTMALTFYSEQKYACSVRTDDQLISTIEGLLSDKRHGGLTANEQITLVDTVLAIVRLHKEQTRAH